MDAIKKANRTAGLFWFEPETLRFFRSRFGWHVVEVMDRRVYDNTEDLKESNCTLRIQNSKMEEESQLWMRRIRDEAFVETRI